MSYVVGENQELQRASDDGEPGGTAGRPMLDVLLKEDLHDTAVIVTRYFGGTLLGTGGLVRAYTAACQAGLASSKILTKTAGVRLTIGTDYSGVGKIQYILRERDIPTIGSSYTSAVELEVLVPRTGADELCKAITEGTNGQASLSPGEECYFAVDDKEVIFL